MSGEPKMFRINPENRESEAISEVEFSRLGFQERRDIQEWVAANPGILGDKLLIIGKEFSEFDRTSERLDLLAVDADGKLVIVELKRDDTGADVHWQAIKYASYFRKASAEDITRILANHAKISEDDAGQQLREHLDSGDLSVLNHDQRIIIASHRFAPEVTSAVLWLNEKAPGENLITCIQLTPYQDVQTNTLYLQTNTIIPVPGDEQYTINLGDARITRRLEVADEYRSDEVTRFLRGVGELAISELEGDLKPTNSSRWAMRGRHSQFGDYRFYRWWYSRSPWLRQRMYYGIHLFRNGPQMKGQWIEGQDQYGHSRDIIEPETHQWEAIVLLAGPFRDALKDKFASLNVYNDQSPRWGNWGCDIEVIRGGDNLDDSFANSLANALRRFIEVCTPEVDDFENEQNLL